MKNIYNAANKEVAAAERDNLENNLYHKSHWKPERKNQKVHKIKAFIPFRWCLKKTVYLSLMEIEKMDTSYS